MYIYIYICIRVCIYIYIYIYTHILAGPPALGVLDHGRVTEVDLSTEIYPPPIIPTGAVLGPKAAAPWLRCGFIVAPRCQSEHLGANLGPPEANMIPT